MYAMIIGDMAFFLGEAFGLEGFLGRREVLVSLLGLVVLIPLCLMRSLSALAPFSVLGVLGVSYIA